jgi:hypothetical protein
VDGGAGVIRCVAVVDDVAAGATDAATHDSASAVVPMLATSDAGPAIDGFFEVVIGRRHPRRSRRSTIHLPRRHPKVSTMDLTHRRSTWTWSWWSMEESWPPTLGGALSSFR